MTEKTHDRLCTCAQCQADCAPPANLDEMIYDPRTGAYVLPEYLNDPDVNPGCDLSTGDFGRNN